MPLRKPRPRFHSGAGRSGTSALTWALGQHPNIIGVPETNWLSGIACYADAFYELGVAAGPDGHLRSFGMSRGMFLQEFGRTADAIVRRSFEAGFPNRHAFEVEEGTPEGGVAWYRRPREPKRRWVDGTPSSTAYAGVLEKMLPGALFINLIRDPVDVIRSTLGFPHRAALGLSDPKEVLLFVGHHQRAGYLAEAAFKEKVMRVRFEDMVALPEQTMAGVLSFVGEPFTSDCIEPLLAGKINATSVRSAEVDLELEVLSAEPLLATMREWYEGAASGQWQIAAKEEAVTELGKYAKHRVGLPAPE